MKLTPSSRALIMLLTALPPAPPTPSTVIRGLSSFDSAALRLIVMYYLQELTSRLPIHTPGDVRIVFRFVHQSTHNSSSEETFAEPAHNATPRRFFFRLRRIGIIGFRRARRARNEKSQSRSVGRPGARRGKTRKGLRPPDANLFVEHLSR